MSYRSDGGWNEVKSKIAEAHPTSPFGRANRRRGIKEVKTEQVVKKHFLDKMQKINNIDIEQSEQLKHNGRILKSNKSMNNCSNH